MKYFKQFRVNGETYFVDERGHEVTEKVAKTNLVESSSRREQTWLVESAADTAAAKALVGHFVRDRSINSPAGMYTVGTVNENGSATLLGPIGKRGKKTISHTDLVSNHEDLGREDALHEVKESARDKMEEAFRRRTAIATGQKEIEETSSEVGRGRTSVSVSRQQATSAMEEALARFVPHTARA